jgi:hypothetical protein
MIRFQDVIMMMMMLLEMLINVSRHFGYNLEG